MRRHYRGTRKKEGRLSDSYGKIWKTLILQENEKVLDEEMPKKEEAYVCKKCGYVLPKKDAVISGWYAEYSSTHVHCPRCGKIIANYVN